MRRQLHRAGGGEQELTLVGAGPRRRRSSCRAAPTGSQDVRHGRRWPASTSRSAASRSEASPRRAAAGLALRRLRPRRRERQDPRQRDHRPPRRARSTAARRGSASASAGTRSGRAGTATIPNNTISRLPEGRGRRRRPWFGCDDHEQRDHGSRPNGSRRAERHPGKPPGDRDSLRQHGLREHVHNTRDDLGRDPALRPSRRRHRLEQHGSGRATGGSIMSSRAPSPTAGREGHVRANTITGGDSGIVVSGTDNTRVEANRTSGAATSGSSR